jgi:hypothetical protein
MKRRRWIAGCLFGAALLAAVIGVLAFATIWTPSELGQRCLEDVAHSQFPKWLGCAIAIHEGLAAGLIATAGVIFAAWLAFMGLQDQIGMAQRNELEAKRIAHTKRVQDAERDLDRVRTAHGFVETLAGEFKAFASGALDPAIVDRMLDLRRRGLLRMSANAVRAPDGNGDRIATVVDRMGALADGVYAQTKDASADMKITIQKKSMDAVAAEVASLRDLERALRETIAKYEARLRAAIEQPIE